MISPIVLEKYFFRTIDVRALLDRKDPEPGAEIDYKVEVQVRSARHQNEDSRWMIDLNIKLSPKNLETKAYEIQLGVIGLFKAGGNIATSPDGGERLVVVNGASILYSSARELLLTLTGRGPFSPVSLPTFNFQAFEKQPDKVAE